jgi:hypothetical protein
VTTVANCDFASAIVRGAGFPTGGCCKPQARRNHLCFQHLLTSLLPIYFVAVISEAPNDDDFNASLQAFVDVVSQGPEGDNPAVDRRKVDVLVTDAVC